jgi:hypothetical protein
MDEIKDKSSVETEMDIEAIIQKESEDALRRFCSGDFVARLKTRLNTPPARRPFFLFRKPVFVPALGLLVLAAAALILGRGPGRGNGLVEAGFRIMTDTLAKTDSFQAGGLRLPPEGPDHTMGGRDAVSFAAALFRVAAGSGTGTESVAPGERDAPLRPLFSPNERFKILYGDQVILRALKNMASHKEV